MRWPKGPRGTCRDLANLAVVHKADSRPDSQSLAFSSFAAACMRQQTKTKHFELASPRRLSHALAAGCTKRFVCCPLCGIHSGAVPERK